MPTPEASLAALRDGDPADRKPFRLKLDSGLSIEAPSPRRLAEVFVLPLLRANHDVYRSGGALLTRPKGSDAEPTALPLVKVTAAIAGKLAALPDLGADEAGRPYRDVRLLTLEGNADTVAAYTDAVARKVVTLAPRWRPASDVDRAPAMTAAERKAAQRERDRAAEEATARWWLEPYLEEDAIPGERVNAAKLYAAAVAIIEDYVADEEELDDGTPYRVPRRRVFFEVADELLGERRRTASGYVYVIPEAPAPEEEPTMTPEQIREEAAAYREAAEAGERLLRVREQLAAGNYVAALSEQRDRLAATGTDGPTGSNVVALASVRGRR